MYLTSPFSRSVDATWTGSVIARVHVGGR